ncbi:hypothetical protein EDP1_3701 [Pseudomonas putida S610]|nr:hypothetical protein EDP1_3701 [Pseudomonas putida S610]
MRVQIDDDAVLGHMPGRRVHQHRHRVAVGEHVANTFGRIVRIDRHIRAARLQDSEQAHHHRQTTFNADRHAIVRLHTKSDQVMSQAVGLGVELLEGQLALLGADRDGLRGALNLIFDQSMQRVIEPVRPFGGVETCQHAFTLMAFEHGQLLHGQRRGALKPAQQRLQHLLHLPADALRADLRRYGSHQSESLAQIIHVQAQRVVGALLPVHHLDTRPAFAAIGTRLGAMAIVEHRAEERLRRRDTTATLRQRQRGMLMGQQVAEPLMHGPGRIDHADGLQVHTQWQGVDEHPQCPLGPFSTLQAPQQHGAEHHARSATGSPEQAGPGQVEQRSNADAQAPSLLAQAGGQGLRQDLPGLVQVATVALYVIQAIRQGRFVDVTQLCGEERLMGALIDPQPGLGHVIAVRHRGMSRCGGTAEQGCQFFAHHLQRRVVQHDVVELQAGVDAVLSLAVHQSQQRRPRQVKGSSGRQVRHGVHAQARLAHHHLHRLRQPFPEDRRTQYIVAGDDLVQCSGKGLQPLPVAKTQARVQHVGIMLGRQVMVEDALLQRRQGVDVLHVGCTARDLRDDSRNASRVQLDQAEHVGGDVRAAGRDAVLRHLDLTAGSERGSQGSHGRLAEQGAHIDLQAFEAQPGSQGDGQQRMAAQFEEIIVSAYLRHRQQFAPQAGQQGFGITHRRLEGSSLHHAVRGGQGFAVELAVWRQWQAIQVNEHRRHHVLGQVFEHALTQCLRGLRVTGVPGSQARTVHRQNHRGVHARQALQAGFDLAWFNPQATQLDLLVEPTKEDQLALSIQAHQVTTAVKPLALDEGVVEETLRLLLGQAQVPARHAGTAYVQVPGNAWRHWLVVCIKYIQAGIVHRVSDRQARDGDDGSGLQRPGAAIDRGLGGAVDVVQAHLGQLLAHLRGQPMGQFTAAAHDVRQP